MLACWRVVDGHDCWFVLPCGQLVSTEMPKKHKRKAQKLENAKPKGVSKCINSKLAKVNKMIVTDMFLAILQGENVKQSVLFVLPP